MGLSATRLSEAADVPVGEAVARFAVATPARALPEGARRVLRLSLLDWAAVALAGRDEPVGRVVRGLVAAEGGVLEASVIGGGRAPARAAALANGTTSHALDYDDTHFAYIGHPSVAVLPAALALAEKTGAGGAAFLDAALIGVETACRVGAWLGREHYQHGFHQTATAGCFGAAMAGARLLGHDGAQAGHALGVAATRASGLKSQFGTMGKPYNAGLAASNGVEAALMARAGFVSRPDGLECVQGFADTHAGGEGDPLTGLGEPFVFESVQHKFHACCHGTHAAIEALATLRRGTDVAPDEIAGVALHVHPRWLRVCDIAAPRTGLEAKFSFRLTAAMALLGIDTASPAAFTDALCAEPGLVALRDEVRIFGDGDLAETAALARVLYRSGATIEARHDLERPMPIDAREAKVRAKAAALIGEDAAGAIWDAVTALDDGGGVEDLTALLRADAIIR